MNGKLKKNKSYNILFQNIFVFILPSSALMAASYDSNLIIHNVFEWC